MNEEQDRIIIPDENGEEHLFDVIFTFDVDETQKSYMVVKPVESSDDEEEMQEVYGFRYEDKDGEFNLYPIETDKEWDMVEEMFNTFLAESDL
ncbi:uncharacterized protein YrzB (UPF0473 family) [Scopulibacillus daqui]|uniref:UPF0473 protein JOD45_002074 n=1 Tax=Scopulibacillus daqui TaxID=1469162 RepID=A0ABS2Q1W7_9BACL|nr:DUF1292 domain-containing protein [Scopulibacillus daqui]MBM7645855.1 uncharacterized protein YrzB (UPF0473 family) [Scopulibacillus daqui]